MRSKQSKSSRSRQSGRVRSKEVAASALKGRRFSEAQRQHALVLIAAKMKRTEVASVIGTTVESLRRWVSDAERRGAIPGRAVPEVDGLATQQGLAAEVSVKKAVAATASAPASRPLYAPRDPAQGLSEVEVAAILELKRKHPSFGPAQLRAQLKRFKGWRLANRAIARVLRNAGYEPVHRGSRPQGPEPVRFEAPRRNALWQADFTDLRVGDDKLALLVILDDFSRFVVGHKLCESQTSAEVLGVLRSAIARHGKPEAVRTDRGGAFTSGELKTALENELIDHIVGRPYHPQGGGKVEAVIGTVKRELWEVEHFADRAEAERRLVEFFTEYNELRAHMGIDGLTPADRFFGRADHVLAHVNALSRKRNAAIAHRAPAGAPVEDGSHGPLEVLRLLVADGRMELRLFGSVVDLGPVRAL